jgi:hypothetical protein
VTGGRLGRTGQQEPREEEAGQQSGEEHEAAEESEHDRLRADVVVDESHPLDIPVGSGSEAVSNHFCVVETPDIHPRERGVPRRTPALNPSGQDHRDSSESGGIGPYPLMRSVHSWTQFWEHGRISPVARLVGGTVP